MFWIHTFLITAIYASWNYDNRGNDWSTTYTDCGGSTQSPVNLDNAAIPYSCPLTNGHTLHHLEWIWDNHNTFNVVNNGHTIKLTPTLRTGVSTFELQNTNLKSIARLLNRYASTTTEHKEYCLDSIHFHFGSGNLNGSEHTVTYATVTTHYPLEAHLVHYSCDYDDIGAALQAYNDEIPTDDYVLGVVAILFEIDNDSPNVFIDRFIQNARSLKHYEDEINLSLFNVADLIPSNIRDYYYYEGSLTTPPCSPVGMFFVVRIYS